MYGYYWKSNGNKKKIVLNQTVSSFERVHFASAFYFLLWVSVRFKVVYVKKN